MQTVDENGADITGGDGADDSAHGTGSETGTERDFSGSAGPARRINTAKADLRPLSVYDRPHQHAARSEEHTSELQSLMRISYAVFCLKKKKQPTNGTSTQRSITK